MTHTSDAIQTTIQSTSPKTARAPLADSWVWDVPAFRVFCQESQAPASADFQSQQRQMTTAPTNSKLVSFVLLPAIFSLFALSAAAVFGAGLSGSILAYFLGGMTGFFAAVFFALTESWYKNDSQGV